MTNLNHFNGNKSIESLFKFRGNFTVVKEVYANTTFESGSLDSFLRKGFLFNRQRQGVNFTSEMTSSLVRTSASRFGDSVIIYAYLDGETTPAAAEFEDSVARFNTSLAQYMVNFA